MLIRADNPEYNGRKNTGINLVPERDLRNKVNNVKLCSLWISKQCSSNFIRCTYTYSK